jgi:hypothetical protein
MLKRLMVVMLLGCIGLTAGVAFGTLFSANNSSGAFTAGRSWNPPTSTAVPFQNAVVSLQGNCHSASLYQSAPVLPPNIAAHHLQPANLGDVGPSGRLRLGSYVLFGLLAGLSAALGFLVPPRSRVTRR